MEKDLEQEKINKTIKRLEESLLVLENIKEGIKIDRFKFTQKEIETFNYVIEVLKANLDDFQN